MVSGEEQEGEQEGEQGVAGSDDPLVSIESLTFRHGDSDAPVFDRLSLIIPRGQITAILGPSGTGKTTLLKLISGQLTPDSGRVRISAQQSGQPSQTVHQLSRRELFALRQRMGMLFQSGALLTDMTVFDNVAYPIREHTRLPPELVRAMVLMKLEAVGLRGAWNLLPAQLSGGMARRVALARAIALDPELILYDEPFVGQDPISMGVLVRLIRSLNDNLRLTSVVVSHDVTELLSIADYCYVVAGGKVVAEGPPQRLQQLTSPRVRQFLDGRADGPVPFHYPAVDYAADLACDLLPGLSPDRSPASGPDDTTNTTRGSDG